MSDNEASIRLQGRAEYQEILAYTRAIRDLTAATKEYGQAAADAERAGVSPGGGGPGGGGGQGGANTGSPPPAPSGPAPGTPPGTPPPPPTPPAPPASPYQAGQEARRNQDGRMQAERENSWHAYGPNMGNAPQAVANRGQSFLSATASTAIGVGLGTSLLGLPMEAINRYMTLSTVIAQVNSRFREASDGAQLFGTNMGYNIGKSAMLSDSLGKVMNTFSNQDATRMAGFARYTGVDPVAALGSLGKVSTLTGKNMGDAELTSILKSARGQGMDQGRLEEFLQRVEGSIKDQFAATGQANLGAAMAAQSLPSLVYPPNDPRRANDTTLSTGVNSMLTQKSGPMAVYMMRAMGYGTQNGPDYMTMRERQDAGIYDSRNVVDLFQSFQDRNMSTEGMFRAVEAASGGSLKANQIRALVGKLGNKGGLDEYKALAANDPSKAGLMDFVDTLATTDPLKAGQQAKMFKEGGFTDLGKSRISAGEGYENRIESMLMKVGSTLAPAIPALQDSLEHFGSALVKLIGGDITEKLMGLTGAVDSIAKFLDSHAPAAHDKIVAAEKNAVKNAVEDFTDVDAYGNVTFTPVNGLVKGMERTVDAVNPWGPPSGAQAGNGGQ